MNKHKRLVSIICTSIFLFLGHFVVNEVFGEELAENRQILVLYHTQASPPYILGEGTKIDSEKPGLTIDLLKLVEKKLNIKFVFKRVPWNRALHLIENNQSDAIFHSSFKPERAEFGVYPMKDGKLDHSRSIVKRGYYLYKLKDSPLLWDGSKLKNLKGGVGAVRGYAVVDDLKKNGVEVDEAAHANANLKKLLRGRVAAVADLEEFTDHQLKLFAKEYANVVKLQPAFKEKLYFLMFSKEFYNINTKLVELIWDEIAKAKASDEFNKVRAKYMQIK